MTARFWLAFLAAVAAGGAARGQDPLLYDNSAGATGYLTPPTVPPAVVGGNTVTNLIADDITLSSAGPFRVTAFSFAAGSFNIFNPNPVSARPVVRFYDNNGPGGGPGTLLAAFTFAPITLAPGDLTRVSVSGAAVTFDTPDNTLWAGLGYDNNDGATGATADDLSLFGSGVFGAPTVGSSDGGRAFETTTPGSFMTNNPDGEFFAFDPPNLANFGWTFRGVPVAPVPEPAGLLAVVGGLVAAWRVRRKTVLGP